MNRIIIYIVLFFNIYQDLMSLFVYTWRLARPGLRPWRRATLKMRLSGPWL